MPDENQNFGTAEDKPAGKPGIAGMVLNRITGLRGGR